MTILSPSSAFFTLLLPRDFVVGGIALPRVNGMGRYSYMEHDVQEEIPKKSSELSPQYEYCKFSTPD